MIAGYNYHVYQGNLIFCKSAVIGKAMAGALRKRKRAGFT